MKSIKTNLLRNLIVIATLTYVFFFANLQSFAQATTSGICPDSTLIRQGYPCDTSDFANHYQPVCGCNGKTYFNICAALNYAGITTYQNGPCDPLAFILWPVPANTNLNIVMAVKDLTTIVHISIYSVATYQFCYEQYLDLSNFSSGVNTFPVDVSTFPRGVYLVLAQTADGSYHSVHRFVKMPTL